MAGFPAIFVLPLCSYYNTYDQLQPQKLAVLHFFFPQKRHRAHDVERIDLHQFAFYIDHLR